MIWYCFLRRVSTPRADVPSLFPLLHVCTQASPKGLSPKKSHLNNNNEQCLHVLVYFFFTLEHCLTILPILLSITCRSCTSTCIITQNDQFASHPFFIYFCFGLFCFFVLSSLLTLEKSSATFKNTRTPRPACLFVFSSSFSSVCLFCFCFCQMYYTGIHFGRHIMYHTSSMGWY